MRKILQIVLCGLVLSLPLSCKKEDSGATDNTPRDITVHPTIGLIWDFDNTNGVSTSEQPSLIGRTVNYAIVGKSEVQSGVTSNSLLTMKGVVPGDKLIFWTCINGASASWDGEKLNFNLPSSQTSKNVSAHVMVGTAVYKASAPVTHVDMKDQHEVIYFKAKSTLRYKIKRVELKSLSGENIVGDVSFDPRTGSTQAASAQWKIEWSKAQDCTDGVMVPVSVATVALKSGFVATFTTDGGDTFTSSYEGATAFSPSKSRTMGEEGVTGVTKLLICGPRENILDPVGVIKLVDFSKIDWYQSCDKGVVWNWSSESLSSISSDLKYKMSKVDECKPVNGGKQLLVTSSYGGAVLLEPDYSVDGKATVKFWTTKAPQAHSAVLLTNNHIAVACAGDEGGTEAGTVQIYKIGTNDTVKSSVVLASAHGLVWSSATSRLYAGGNSIINVYKFNSSTGVLTEEGSVTNGGVTGIHDIMPYEGDDSKIVVAGTHNVAIVDVVNNTSTRIKWFNSDMDDAPAGLKSINYNPRTNQYFYTFATESTAEGEHTYTSYKVRFTKTPEIDYSSLSEKYFSVAPLNMYKVRVLEWEW